MPGTEQSTGDEAVNGQSSCCGRAAHLVGETDGRHDRSAEW